MTANHYKIEGMHCASCANIITRTLKKDAGVNNASVNYATEEAQIDFDAKKTSIEKLNTSLISLGYKIQTTDQNKKTSAKNEELTKKRQQTGFSLPPTLAIFLIMIYEIITKLLPSLPTLPLPMPIYNLFLFIIATIFLFWIGQPFLLGLIRFLRNGAANMDTLIGLGTAAAYFYSAAMILFPNLKLYLQAGDTLYFDVTIIVIGFVTLGKYLEIKSKTKTGAAVEKLIGLQAKSALVWRDNQEVEIPLEQVIIDDIIIIKPGVKIPVDGVVIEGESSIDESMINGEAMPVDKKTGDIVVGGTINCQGYFKFRATKIGNDTVLARIINLVQTAQGSRAPIQSLADKISAVFVPIVLLISSISLVIWLTLGTSSFGWQSAFSYGLMSFVGVLVIACPCALGLATPTAIIVGIGRGAENGILIKDATALEKLSHINILVVDKTGTITIGEPTVTDVLSVGKTERELLSLTAGVENKSEHPLARAIVNKAKENKIEVPSVTNFQAKSGHGVEGVVDGHKIEIHKPSQKESEKNNQITLWQKQGKTVVVVTSDNILIGIIAIADTIKSEAKKMIKTLQKNNVEVVMITGDNPLTASYIAEQAGIKSFFAGFSPEQKAKKIKEFQDNKKTVAMAGDGINDAPALAQADVGIAMGNGTDIAIETADITLLRGDISKITASIQLAHKTVVIIKQNLFWAFIYNIVGIPLAAGLMFPLFGIFLNPIFAGAAMAISSVSVVTNSLRLRKIKLL